MRALHWFRADLRLADNTALAAAAARAGELGFLFVLDDALLASTVGATRTRLAVPSEVVPTAAEGRAFVAWMTMAAVFSVLTWFGPYVLVGWAIVRLVG